MELILLKLEKLNKKKGITVSVCFGTNGDH